MNEKFNKNAKVEKFTTMLGIAVRLIVIDPLLFFVNLFWKFLDILIRQMVRCKNDLNWEV